MSAGQLDLFPAVPRAVGAIAAAGPGWGWGGFDLTISCDEGDMDLGCERSGLGQGRECPGAWKGWQRGLPVWGLCSCSCHAAPETDTDGAG